jgi:hypothetical protein
MSKSVLGALVTAVIVAGCVNVAAPSADPSATPGAATPTGSVATTAPPSASAVATPTTAPTITAAPTPTTAPTPEPTEDPGDPGFDQRDVDFIDDLGDPSGHCTTGPAQDPPVYPEDCWGVGTNSGGSVAYEGGSLHFDTIAGGAWLLSRRLANSVSATMRVIAEFYPTDEGRFGVMCGSGDERMFGAIVSTDGSWAIVKLGDLGAEELFGDPQAGLDIRAGQSTPVALECTGTATGALRLTLWVGESGPVATWTQPNGPENFDRAAIYLDSSGGPASVRMDNVAVFGSQIEDGSFNAEAEDLLAHVPEDWQPSCHQGLVPPYLARTAEAVVTCFLSNTNADGAELAEYVSFASAADMDLAFQRRVDAFGSGDTDNTCDVGPTETPWHFGEDGPDIGRLLCAGQFAGIRFDWTDNRLNILSSMVDFDGNYARTYDDWQVAGPNE